MCDRALSRGRALVQDARKRGGVGSEGIAHVVDACERSLAGLLIPGSTGVRDDDGDVTEVGAVPDRRLDADLHRDAADGEGGNSAVAECDIEWGSLEGGEADLVEDRLARSWGKLGQQLEAGRVAQKPGSNVGGPSHPLPGHRLPQLEDAGELDRKREVTEEDDAHPGAPRRRECLEDAGGDGRGILKLTQDADLHVINEEREPP